MFSLINSSLNLIIFIQILTSALPGLVSPSSDSQFVEHWTDYLTRIKGEIRNKTYKGHGVATHTRDKSTDPSYVLDQYFNHVIPSYFSRSVFCSDASRLTNLLMNRIRTNATLKDTEDVALQDCKVTKNLPHHQCKGFVERFVPTFYYIVKKRAYLTTDTFVSTTFQSAGCGWIKMDPYMEWSIKIDDKRNIDHLRVNYSPSENLNENNTQQQNSSRTTRKSRGHVKILQLTDINLDIFYETGSNADCAGFGPCCESDSGPLKNKSSAAGPFGDGRTCDSPDALLDQSLNRIAIDHPDINLIYFNGDMIPHDHWRSTKIGNSEVITYVTQLIAFYFPNANIVPVLGDQEPHPAHQFSPPGELSLISTNWIYDTTLKAWTSTHPPWIPEDQLTLFQIGGYYTKKIGSLKIIVLNTNVCYERNLWQMFTVKDPFGQLEWLEKELQGAEGSGQFVHIIGHVPPGSFSCTKVWSRNYHNIIARYHTTVKAQIFGHETIDTFHLFYKPKGQQEPLSVQWVAPSFSPRQSNNPSYRIYYAHPYTWDLMDYDSYVVDLKRSNANPKEELKWKLLYRATEAYNIPDLGPSHVAELVERMTVDNKLLATYLQYSGKELKSRDVNSCNTYCRKKALCRIVTPYISEEEECQALQRKIDGVVIPIYTSN